MPTIISAAPSPISWIFSFNARAEANRSEDKTAMRASGQSAAISSANLSIPGPIAAMRPATEQLGHASNKGCVSPH